LEVLGEVLFNVKYIGVDIRNSTVINITIIVRVVVGVVVCLALLAIVVKVPKVVSEILI